MPANIIKKMVSEGKGTTESLEKKWDEAKKSAEGQGADDKWALTMHIFQNMVKSSTTPIQAKLRLKATE